MNTRNKGLLITGILVGIAAVIALLVGGWLAGWDFKAFFLSKTFFWIAFLVGAYIVVLVSFVVKDKVNRL